MYYNPKLPNGIYAHHSHVIYPIIEISRLSDSITEDPSKFVLIEMVSIDFTTITLTNKMKKKRRERIRAQWAILFCEKQPTFWALNAQQNTRSYDGHWPNLQTHLTFLP